jgi:hypothetical protein
MMLRSWSSSLPVATAPLDVTGPASDLKKHGFLRTNKSCRVLFKHMKKHGLGFVLDLELDEVQMNFLLVVWWKAFGGLDCSE